MVMSGVLPLPLAEIFTAPGVIAWAAVVTLIVQFLKKLAWFPVPESGRGVLYAVAVVAGCLVLLAAWDTGFSMFANPTGIIGLLLTWISVSTAAVGTAEATSKAVRVVRGTTNPTGPDSP